jgi:MFS family permease
MQQLRGFSAIKTGLILMPTAVMVATLAPVSGWLYPKIGPKRMLAFAMSIFVASSLLLLLVDLSTSTFWLVAILALRGVGMAFTFVPLQAASFATIKPEDTGQASSIFNTNRQVASSVGVALLATVLIERTHAHTADAGLGASANAVAHAGVLGYHDAFFASAILGLIGLVFTLIIRDEDAAATMVRGSGETVSDVDEGSVVGLTVQNG